MAREKETLKLRLVRAWMRWHGRLPLGYHRACGRVLGWLIGSVMGYRKQVVTRNLTRCFPEKPAPEIARIRKQFYRHLATVLTETVWFGACRGPKGRKRLHDSHIVEIDNPEVLNDLYAGARQIMILQSHTGNWELIGGIREYSYGPELTITPEAFAVTYLWLHNPLWQTLMEENRTAPVADQGFQGYVEAGTVMRYVLERRDRKFGYSFITDQYPYNDYHKPVVFMGYPTLMMTGAASLACKLDMAVVYLRFECRPEGGYRMHFVPLAEHAGGQDPEQLMKKYFTLLEEDLAKQPWNYLWTHKRWKDDAV